MIDKRNGNVKYLHGYILSLTALPLCNKRCHLSCFSWLTEGGRSVGVRRNRREKERLTDSDITRARLYYASLARNPSQIPVLPTEPEARYDVPVSGPAQLVYRGLPLDEVEDLLPQSAAYRQAGRILFAEPVSATGRPLTPLHAGHVGLLACSGLLNGIFGSGDQRHISFWQAVKLVDKTEEEDDHGVVTIREKERFSNELTVVYSTGQVAILK